MTWHDIAWYYGMIRYDTIWYDMHWNIVIVCFLGLRPASVLPAPGAIHPAKGNSGGPKEGGFEHRSTMRVWTCKELRAKRDRTGCYVRPPFLGSPLVLSRILPRRAQRAARACRGAGRKCWGGGESERRRPAPRDSSGRPNDLLHTRKW